MATVRIRFRYSSLLAAGVAPCQIRVTMLNSVLVVEYPWSLLFRSRCPWTPEASRPVPLLRLRHKAIAHSPHRLQVLRLRRILFYVPPQPHHKNIDSAGFGIFAQST